MAEETEDKREGERINILGELHGEVMVYQPTAIREISRRGAQGPSLGVTLQPVPLRGAAFGFLLLKVDPGSAAEAASP